MAELGLKTLGSRKILLITHRCYQLEKTTHNSKNKRVHLVIHYQVKSIN